MLLHSASPSLLPGSLRDSPNATSRSHPLAPFLRPQVDLFCRRHVEVMGEESDNMHIVALTDALQVPVRVVYLNAMGAGVNSHDFVPEGLKGADAEPRVALLYRPGHYDILYPRAAER